MDVDVAVLTGLQLVAVHEELAVQLFVQLVKNQASLRCNEGAVGVGIALVADVADGLALRVDLVHHMDKISFVIAVIAVAFCHSRVYFFECSLHDIVHIADRNFGLSKGIYVLGCELTDKVNLLL